MSGWSAGPFCCKGEGDDWDDAWPWAHRGRRSRRPDARIEAGILQVRLDKAARDAELVGYAGIVDVQLAGGQRRAQQ